MPDWGNLAEPLGTIIGFVLTLMVFSYIFGDNFLFRLATHIFIGVATGYAAVLVIYNIIFPMLAQPGNELVRLGPPLILGVWLLTKTSPRLSRLGNPVLAYLVGVGQPPRSAVHYSVPFSPWWISPRASSPAPMCWM